MKNFLFFFLLIPILAFSQVPQGVGYQGVATDAAGFELINQSISIRASVISGSTTGTIQWQEIHNTSTDTFGLFNLTIGQGVSTGNGALTSFADITWGANTHFLKIEMDVNGGTNYSHMGTNQMMSVPYALYAENANINYDSIATILSNDSTFINNFSFGGNMVFGDLETLNLNGRSPSWQTFLSDSIFTEEDGFLFVRCNGGNSSNNGTVNVNLYSDSLLSSPYYQHKIKFGSATGQIETITLPIKKNTYFNITAFDGANWFYSDPKWLPIINGSSSSSTVDSSYIDSLVQFYSSGNGGGGCDLKFPDGLDGEMIAWDFNNGDYNVPSGKNLFISNVYTLDGYAFRINGMKIIDEEWGTNGNNNLVGGMLKLPLCAKSGDIVSNSTPTGDKTFYGLLVDEIVEPITFEFDDPGTGFDTYTVPVGKKLYIMNIWAYGGANYNSQLTVDGVIIAVEPFNKPSDADNKSLNIPLIINSGSVVSIPDGFASFNGYLADENYFSDCGGGGSSSSTIDSSYIDSLVQYYVSNNTIGGCNIDPFYPDGMEGVEYKSIYITNSTPYTVPANKTFYLFSRQTNLYLNGNGRVIEYDHFFPIPIAEGNVLSLNGGSINGYLIDKGFEVKNYLGGDSLYIVPNDMYFYVLHNDSYINVDGITSVGGSTNYPSGTSSARTPLVIQPNSFITSPYGISGLLIPTDNCNQGSSSSSTIDSSYIDSLVQFYSSGNGGGCDFQFPDGYDGEFLTHDLSNNNSYSVPAGKNLYVTNIYVNSTWPVEINGISITVAYINSSTGNSGTMGNTLSNPLLLKSGDIINSGASGASFNGFLVEGNVNPLTHDLSNNNSYSVPAGKNLYVTNIYVNSTLPVEINGISITSAFINSSTGNSGTMGNTLSNPLLLKSGDIINSGASGASFNGYLVDEDYFADCGGGGSSITNSSSGPNFINPILITNTLCGSGNLLNDSIRINVDSILGQNISSLIIHSDFSGPSIYNTNNSHSINLDVSSYNGIFSTPIFSIITQLDGIGYATKITDVNNQTTIPNSNSGIINLVITGSAISNGSNACNSLNGNIKIVGYY